MKVRLWWCPAVAMLLVAARPGAAQNGNGTPKEQAAIQKNAEAFVDAFHKGNAKAVAAFWMTDGDYTDQTGRHLKGRAAIEKAFTGLFSEQKGLKLHIDSHSLRFATSEVAIEDGTTAVIPPDGMPPSQARYTIVHVKKDGQWLLASVRDAPFSPPSNQEHLRGLEWTVGDWADESAKGEVERLSVSWTENQNFLVASFSTTVKNIRVGNATQWIGYDPLGKQVRSWIFDASGAFGEGSWSQDGKKWLVKTTTVLQDGKKAAATLVVTHIDADTIALQSRDRTVDGQQIPDTRELKLKRVK